MDINQKLEKILHNPNEPYLQDDLSLKHDGIRFILCYHQAEFGENIGIEIVAQGLTIEQCVLNYELITNYESKPKT